MGKMPWERLLVAALLLGSCDQHGHTIGEAYDLAEAANANARNALYRLDNLPERTATATDLDDLRSDISRLQRQLNDVVSAHEALRRTVNGNADAFNRHLRGGGY